MMPWEKRSFRTEMEHMGGSEFTVPTQARVTILGVSPARAQETITAGTGASIAPGFRLIKDMVFLLCFMDEVPAGSGSGNGRFPVSSTADGSSVAGRIRIAFRTDQKDH